jgi:hypothetical protein
MEEVWKDVVGYEGLYQVSNLGRVKAITYIRNKRDPHFGERVEKIHPLGISRYGYYRTGLSKNGKGDRRLVHRLVAEAFIPKEDGKDFIDHINGIKTDNRVENLRWVTPKENSNNPATKGNFKNMFNQLSPDKKAEVTKRCVEATSIGILQLDSDYNIVGEYKNAQQASRETGYLAGSIYNSRYKKIPLYGYYWVAKKDYDEFMRNIL